MSRKCNEAYMLELAHKLDVLEPVARSMLAALQTVSDRAIPAGTDSTGQDMVKFRAAMLETVRSVIAQAKATGIKV